MLKQSEHTETNDLNTMQGPESFARSSYAENLRENLIRHLIDHLKALSDDKLGGAVLKTVGFEEAGVIFGQSQDEALQTCGGVSREEFFQVGLQFGLYRTVEETENPSRLPVDSPAKS